MNSTFENERVTKLQKPNKIEEEIGEFRLYTLRQDYKINNNFYFHFFYEGIIIVA